jgi:hypothetical protein
MSGPITGSIPRPKEESDIIGTFHFRWGETSMLYEIETGEGFSREDLLQELGRRN